MTAAAAVAAAAALVMLAVLIIAWPFVSPEREGPEQRLSDDDRRRLALAEARDAAYASLRDLEADYQAERDRLRVEAARVLRELDQLR